jgi:hypothetical protein
VQPLEGTLFLCSSKNGIVVSNGSNEIVVGVQHATKKFKVRINLDNVKKSVDVLQEDCAAKGTGLGFSSYIHCYAMVIVCLTDAEPMYEPRELFDVRTTYGTFEITGKNAHRRRTTADFCVSKYALIKAVMTLTPDLVTQFELSKKEDASDPSCFWGSSFDQTPSPYTSTVREMAELTRQLDRSQKEAMAGQFRHWLSSQKPIENDRPETNNAPAAIAAAFKRGSKEQMLPAPLKVAYPGPSEPPDDFAEMFVCPHTS